MTEGRLCSRWCLRRASRLSCFKKPAARSRRNCVAKSQPPLGMAMKGRNAYLGDCSIAIFEGRGCRSCQVLTCAGHVEHACHGTECKLCLQVLKPMTPRRQRRGDGLRHTSDTSLELATSLLYLAARPAARRLKTTTTALMLSSS